jgi:hypothetical protein
MLGNMQTNEILEAIDQQISQLQQARALLTNQASQLQTGKRRGRPKSSDSKTAKVSAPAAVKTSKRTMSEEGKARIAAAQKARWAAKKRATKSAKSAVAKSAPATVRTAIKSALRPGKKQVAPANKTARVIGSVQREFLA